MKLTLAGSSWLLLALSVVLLLVLTLFEAAMLGLSFATERLISFLLLFLPAAAGAVLAVISLVRKEKQAWIALIALILNSLFALFHLMILLFAG